MQVPLSNLSIAVARAVEDCPQAMPISATISPFKPPLRACSRPLAFWAWNDRMSEGRLRADIAAFASAGFGGVFMHPRPGLVTEYLSNEWFALCRVALACCSEHGLSCSIYDENSFPSGFAGGHVAARDPLAIVRRLDLRMYPAGSPRPKQLLIALEADETGLPRISQGEERAWEVINRHACFAVELNPASARRWFGGFAEVDLTRPGAGEAFMATTHERYREVLGEALGRQVPYVFTDEPQLGNVRGWLYSESFEVAFQRDHGFPLRDRLADLFVETESAAETRHAYHVTAQRLLERNFFIPLHGWAEAHKVELTGHVMEDHWPSPAHGPSTSGLLRWFQAPGLDLLAFQFRPAPPEEVIRWRHLALQVTSLADQLGRPSRICEACGGGGYGYGPADAKPLIDLLIGHGINRVVPHLSLSSLSGPRRYDWPQTFSPSAPWWPAHGAHQDYIHRMIEALEGAQTRNRVLLLEPNTVLWGAYLPEVYGQIANPSRKQIEAVRSDFSRTLLFLLSHGVEVDVADEWLLQEMGNAGPEGLTVGLRTYQAVVLPASWMAGLLATARWLVPLFEDNRVCALGAKPTKWDGRAADPLGEVSWSSLTLDETLVSALDALAPRRWYPHTVEPALCVLLREREDGTAVLFLANPHNRVAKVDHFFGPGQWHQTEASADAIISCQDPVKGHFTGHLPPGGHSLWEITSALPSPPVVSQQSSSPVAGKSVTVASENWCLSRGEPNIAVITHGTIRTSAGREERLVFPQIDRQYWHEQGQPSNPWSFAVQYRQTISKGLRLTEGPFAVTSYFTVEQAALQRIRGSTTLIIDRPMHLKVLLNGNEVTFSSEASYLDPSFLVAEVGAFLTAGPNELVLRPREPHPEICFSPPWLRGDFSVTGPLDQVTLTTAKSLVWGGWEKQGLPYFAGTVCLEATIRLSNPAHRLRLALPEAAISSLQISLDESPWESVCHRPWVWDHHRELSAGPHVLRLKVTGSQRNLLGPHFSTLIPHAWAWLTENSPRQPDPFGVPRPPQIMVWSR